jgi:serine/threonine protein phosphatase PrpC
LREEINNLVHVKVWCQTDVGLKRANNEDCFLLDPDLGLYIVADGMGGHSGGEVASHMAVKALRDVIIESYEKDAGIKPQDLLMRAYSSAGLVIFEKSLSDGDLKGMGTTLVAALIRDQKIYFGNVGDSRAYLLNPSGMWQLTEDHSLVNEQLKAGILKDDSKAKYAKNIITRSVGFERNTLCDVLERSLKSEDTYLICSDGLTGMLEDEEIYEIARKNKPENVVAELIKEAKNKGGLDNVTVMYMTVTSK